MDNSGSDLEERLRNLILANAAMDMGLAPPARPVQTGLAENGQPESLEETRLSQSPQSPNIPAAAPVKAGRKRPNQAQRRQMSAQLTIPIDPRPVFSEPSRPYTGNEPHGSPSHQQQGHHHQQHRHNGRKQYIPQTHSAGIYPTIRSDPLPSTPMTASPFVMRPRHQPSHSYHGPVEPNQFGWQQPPPMPHGGPRVPPGFPPMPFGAPPGLHPGPRPGQGGLEHFHSGRQYHPHHSRGEDAFAQAAYLEQLCRTIVADAEIEPADIIEKENFRAMIEQVARAAITEHERKNGFLDFPPESVQLKCFGSLSSGFATKAADMDLGLLSPLSRLPPDAPGSPIPRIVEKAFLDIGLGARLLSRTRVPIIKVCERPTEELRKGLLEERAKWERGLTGSEEPEDEEGSHEDAEAHETAQSTQAHRQKDEELTHDQWLEKLQTLKQAETQPLQAYYNMTKKILRKLGGHDITNSNISDFNMDDYKLLNRVCMAFVNGLADANLRDRLLKYRSLNNYDLCVSFSAFRTLWGILTQVEGETMAMAWETRPIRERDQHQEQHAERAVRAWRDIQNKPDYGRDPLGYQKELQHCCEQLRKIASVQILFLSQGQHESASKYYLRAKKLLEDLGGKDSVASKDDLVLKTVIEYYIKGIFYQHIREQVAVFAQSYEAVSLRAVGRRHKSLQLAHEYENCLEKGLYPAEAATKIRIYIELLKGPMVPSPSSKTQTDAVIPLPKDADTLISELRQLGDPAGMAPNQPRDRYNNPLEFPKSGVGVQCDINFSAHLALQNTLLLRCYSHCDPRVRPLILFVKHWAKVRRINTPYRGTLSSYGYVLMMLHFLVNIAQPFVLPNLQQLAPPPPPNLTPQEIEETVVCRGWNVQFWRDEAEIKRLAAENQLTQNRESIGELLRGFFEYYAKGGGQPLSTLPGTRGFDWGRDVISLRTLGGLLTKQQKGWTGAKTVVEPAGPVAGGDAANGNGNGEVVTEKKEVRYRYLFAIEDPFELDHNVARTVTHAGIVNIRDEFRRAWRIIRNAGRTPLHGQGHKGKNGGGPAMSQETEDLLEDIGAAETERERVMFAELLEDLHGIRDEKGE